MAKKGPWPHPVDAKRVIAAAHLTPVYSTRVLLRVALDQRERITALEAELATAKAEAQAARDWIDREWKALSKSPPVGGHRAAALTILEADLDAVRDGGAHG